MSYVAAAPGSVEIGDVLSQLPGVSAPALPRLSETPPEVYERAATQIQSRLPQAWSTVNRYPFVLTGNVSEQRLQQALRGVVLPTYRALMVEYFDHAPAEPITLVLMSDDASYVDAVGRLGYSGRKEYAGIYSRRDRRLILNLASGDGTIAHELTHALAHADFLRMPEWFDEGLAALHEESSFTDDGLRLLGLPNWRDAVLADALRHSRPPTIKLLVTSDFGGRNPEADYALSRNLCRYLQYRGVLGAFYRKCRTRIHDDPNGARALLEVSGCRTLEELDDKFRRWFASSASRASNE